MYLFILITKFCMSSFFFLLSVPRGGAIASVSVLFYTESLCLCVGVGWGGCLSSSSVASVLVWVIFTNEAPPPSLWPISCLPIKPWLPASPGRVCAWAPSPAPWCCKSAARPWWPSAAAEAGSWAASLPAAGPPGAGCSHSPAVPRGERPEASGQHPCPLCAWSLTRQERRIWFENCWKKKLCSFLVGPVCNIELHLIVRKHTANNVNPNSCFWCPTWFYIFLYELSCKGRIMKPKADPHSGLL